MKEPNPSLGVPFLLTLGSYVLSGAYTADLTGRMSGVSRSHRRR
jgi:hypothetical protein